jgi:hypothetical protein
VSICLIPTGAFSASQNDQITKASAERGGIDGKGALGAIEGTLKTIGKGVADRLFPGALNG